MTREEAKRYIGELKMYAKSQGWDEEYQIACDVAMNELEQEPNNSENPTGSIEIKVGDEVTVAGVNGIVVREPYPIGSDNELFVLVWYGQYMSSNSLKNVAPTGRHFPQITEVLEQLRKSCC